MSDIIPMNKLEPTNNNNSPSPSIPSNNSTIPSSSDTNITPKNSTNQSNSTEITIPHSNINTSHNNNNNNKNNSRNFIYNNVSYFIDTSNCRSLAELAGRVRKTFNFSSLDAKFNFYAENPTPSTKVLDDLRYLPETGDIYISLGFIRVYINDSDTKPIKIYQVGGIDFQRLKDDLKCYDIYIKNTKIVPSNPLQHGDYTISKNVSNTIYSLLKSL
ncbi:hypothetical protein CYY_004893 [Polysphondylium violaceum]|uniref:Uncharacterized protein n=1 Tax=Polysphondylium violaceum TaxID=133409 RepID=A0A8J4V7C0_9MYCE|nr:hypothetical protein CYY_004893 [Polysphondylium violaceum]